MSRYEKPNHKHSIWQLINSVLPYSMAWYLAAMSMSYSLWVSIPLSVIASGLFIRIFIIFHDCGHYSFFRNRRGNEIVGMMTGILTFFSYYKWRYDHAVHHATSGNLDHRGTGDLWILTVKEYLELPLFRRFLYRLYRNPFVMFGFGPIYLLVQSRFNRKGAGRKERWNTYLTNFVLLVCISLLCWILGWQTVLVVQGTILYCSGVVGVWLFYVQHQFEGTYFEESDKWDYFTAALRGSSYYKLPKLLQWVTGNIGLHHVHHLGPRIPNYNLQQFHDNNEFLQEVPQIKLRESLRFLGYRLWDAEAEKFVGFRTVRGQK